MTPEYEKSLTVPSAEGPQFRPAKGFLVTLGSFLVLIGLAIGYLFFFLADEFGRVHFEEVVGLIVLVEISVVCLALGVGSIVGKKWARDMLLALGWCAIAVGGIILVMSVMMWMEQVKRGFTSLRSDPFLLLLTFGQILILPLLVAGPGALCVVIYRMKRVYLTTRYFDQSPSFTDNLSPKQMILFGLYFIGLALSPLTWLSSDFLDVYRVGFSDTLSGIFVLVNTIMLVGLLVGATKGARWVWWASLVYGVLLTGLGVSTYQLAYSDGVVGNPPKNSYHHYRMREIKMFAVSIGISLTAFFCFLFWIRNDFFPKADDEVESSDDS